jgi:predicted alpha/beta-hydrolase family hydrolase
MMEEKFYFKNKDDLKLCGILTKSTKETKSCIVLCHDITVDKEEGGIFTELAKKLANVGFAVFRFDFR